MRFKASLPAPLLLLVIVAQGLGQTPSFAPDKTFQGSNLDGWHTVGNAKWQANNGVIDADGRAGSASGWLFLDHPYQDTGLYAAFRCDGACDTGILLRAEKSGGSTEGLFLAIKGNDAAAYRITLDRSGNEIAREKLRNAGGLIRFAPPSPSPADGPAPPLRRPMTPAPPGVTLPLAVPAHGLKENEWNDVEVLLDADLLRAFFDDGSAQVSTATENTEGFGPFALYVGAGTAVHFRNLAWKDLAGKTLPDETVSPHFRKQQISPFYYGWSAAAADFNRDGTLDIVSGPYIYYGPDYTKYREIYPAQGYNSSTQFSMNDWVEHAFDFMGKTPEESAGGVVFTEPHGTAVADVDGDGVPDFIVGKRLWSHLDDYYDPDPYGAPVLYWYKTVRDPKAPGGARFVPELIHNRSGAGSDVLAVDLNHDGAVDIVTSVRGGTYIFWGIQGKQSSSPK
jgi:hypothetical protein